MQLRRSEIPTLAPRLEVGAYFGIGGLSHPATQRVAEDKPLVGDGFTLEETVPRIGQGLSGVGGILSGRWCSGPFVGVCDYLSGLIPELGGNFPVSREYLRWSERVLLFAGRMRGNLRCFRAAEAGLFQLLPDLLGAKA